jgi:hypothetical protein
MTKGHIISDRLLAAIKQAIGAELRNPKNPRSRPGEQGIDHQEILPPEMYFAKVPTGGIPGADTSGGTPTVSGAECDIYQVSFDDGTAEVVVDSQKKVFNPSTSDIPEDTYALITRDKFGTWWVIPTVAGSSGRKWWLVRLLSKRRIGGCWFYAFNGPIKPDPKDKCVYEDCSEDCLTNDIGATITTVENQVGGTGINAKQTICIHDATAGTFDMTLYPAGSASGGVTVTVQWDGSDFCSLVSGTAGVAVTSAAGINCTTGSGSGTCFLIEYLDGDNHILPTFDTANLLPLPKKGPLVEWRNIEIPDSDLNSTENPPRVMMTTRYQANKVVSFLKTVVGTPGDPGDPLADPPIPAVDPTNTTWAFYLKDVCGGVFTITTEEGTTTELAWNVDGSGLADALNTIIGIPDCITVTGTGIESDPFIITYTCDNEDHTWTIDSSSDSLSTKLFDCTSYGFGWWLGGSGSGGCKGKTGTIRYLTSLSVFCDPDSGAIGWSGVFETSHFVSGCWQGATAG